MKQNTARYHRDLSKNYKETPPKKLERVFLYARERWGRAQTWLNLVWRVVLTSSKARRREANSLRASSETRSLAMPSQSIFLEALKATSATFFPAPLIFSSFLAGQTMWNQTIRCSFCCCSFGCGN